MFETIGYIQNVTEQGVVTLVAPTEKSYRIDHQEIYQARVIFDDGRLMTAVQRKAIFATLNDIAKHSGHELDEIETHFKVELIKKTGCDYFTFSSKPIGDRLPCDVTTARLYLRLLIDFCLRWDIPTKESLLSRAEDTGKYLYACLIYKKCAICQRPGELHHIDAIGSAYRATTEHIGRESVCLCRIHHDECHALGRDTFEKHFNIFGIKIDKTIAKKHNLPLKGAYDA